MGKIEKNNIVASLLFLLAAFLRLYRLPEFVTFLGDQGRDAIVIRDILTFKHFPAIGAASSVGGVYLGPFYYYFISPFLLMSRFNPVGLAYGVAFLSIIGLIAAYLITRKSTNISLAIIFLILATFSFTIIDLSRFSWNPNLLPIFSFLTLFFYKQLLDKRKIIWAVLFGSFFSFSIQLHYLALFLAFPILIYFIYFLFIEVKELKKFDYKYLTILILTSILSFVLFTSPLIIFDFRHDFLNARNLISFFSNQNPATHTPIIQRLIDTFSALITHTFRISLPLPVIVSVYAIILCSVYVSFKRRNTFVFLHILNMLCFLIVFSMLESARHPHYFGSIYFSFFIAIAYVITLKRNIVFIGLSYIILGIYLFFNFRHYYFLNQPGSNQIERAQKYAASIIPQITVTPYQLTSIPPTESDGHIRYFLELGGKEPLPDNSIDQPSELFVLCYEKNCQVLGNAQWQIAAFKNAKINDRWKVENVTIYKLIHEK